MRHLEGTWCYIHPWWGRGGTRVLLVPLGPSLRPLHLILVSPSPVPLGSWSPVPPCCLRTLSHMAPGPFSPLFPLCPRGLVSPPPPQHVPKPFLPTLVSPSPVTPLMSPGVLEESEDVLVNVTLVAEEQAQENAELRKKKPPYIPYEDEDPAAATQVRPLLVSPHVPCMSPLLQARHPALSRVFL